MILLHTFWSVIFFDSVDNSKHLKTLLVVVSHLIVSALTLLNVYGMYSETLGLNIFITLIMGVMAFQVAGGSLLTFKRFAMCK